MVAGGIIAGVMLGTPAGGGSVTGIFLGITEDCIIPTGASMLASALCNHGFKVSRQLQLEQKIAPTTIKEVFWSSIKAAPGTGGLLGLKLSGRHISEKILFIHTPLEITFPQMVVTSLSVSLCSAACISFIGTREEAKMLFMRDAPLLLGIRTSNVIGRYAKEQLGNHKAVELGAQFACGAIGAALGHVGDTKNNRFCNEMSILSLSKENFKAAIQQNIRGIGIRSVAFGCFTVAYNFFNFSAFK